MLQENLHINGKRYSSTKALEIKDILKLARLRGNAKTNEYILVNAFTRDFTNSQEH